MTDRSPARSNPSGSVGVLRGRTRAPATMAMGANELVDDGELRGGRGSSGGGHNQRGPSPPKAASSGEILATTSSSGSGEKRGLISGKRGGEWCAE